MNRWPALLISCLVLGLVAGCGGDDEDDGKADGGSVPTAEQPAETDATTGGGAAVSMKDIKFIPMDVTVKVGATIKWTNDDSIIHTVTKTSGPGGEFDSGNVAGGDTFEQKFEKPGKVDYVCKIHPQQTGTITVE
ncbi:MAG: cupredoxin domain-containing protein [Thermoleophilaceae bacterium]